MQGYFEIGIFQPKREYNVGTLWRSALQLGAGGIFTIGRRYRFQSSDTFRTGDQLPLQHYLSFEDFLAKQPPATTLVAIEMGGVPLSNFTHPERAVYLLGAEDNGLPPSVLKRCEQLVSLEAVGPVSYNLAVAGSLVMYHRRYLQP